MTDGPQRMSMIRSYTWADLLTLANAICGTVSIFACLSYIAGEQTQWLWTAFVLPILQRLLQERPAESFNPYCVVLSPTRELVVQIAGQFSALASGTSLRIGTAFGGTAENPQIEALSAGCEILVGAPGRVLDLMGRGWLQYRELRFVVRRKIAEPESRRLSTRAAIGLADRLDGVLILARSRMTRLTARQRFREHATRTRGNVGREFVDRLDFTLELEPVILDPST